MVKLKNIAWGIGIHSNFKEIAWKVLLGYISPWMHTRDALTHVRRELYLKHTNTFARFMREEKYIIQIIHQEVKNTAALVPAFRYDSILKAIERATYICYKKIIF